MSTARRPPSYEELLTAAGRDGVGQAQRLEAQLWRRNARFRAWAGFLPLEARWAREGARYSLRLCCTTCGREQARSIPELNLLVRRVERVLDLSERQAISSLRCSHLEPLLGEDPEEVQLILELELLAGP